MTDTTDLVRQLIRNRCVNDGTAESGHEYRSVDTLQDFFGVGGRVFEPAPGRQSLLYRIPGTAGGPSLALMGHLDVVPADPDGWKRDPFGAEVVDEFVWGRGAVDMLNLTGAMAAVFRSYLAGEREPLPGDLVFLALADEEAGGEFGADSITAQHWNEVAVDYMLTEIAYPALAPGGLPLVQVAEKGPLFQAVTTAGVPGHASQPFGTANALTVMARAIASLADAATPIAISPDWQTFVGHLPVEPALRGRLTDPDALDSALEELSASDPLLARYVHACTHLTISPTMLDAGVKVNVIPGDAHGAFDVRVLPGQDESTLAEHVRKTLGSAADRLTFEPFRNHPATSSPAAGLLWEALGDAYESLDDSRAMVPVLTPASTDARFWRTRGTVAYGAGRFDGAVGFGEFLSMFHGHDERVSIESINRTERLLSATVQAFGARAG